MTVWEDSCAKVAALTAECLHLSPNDVGHLLIERGRADYPSVTGIVDEWGHKSDLAHKFNHQAWVNGHLNGIELYNLSRPFAVLTTIEAKMRKLRGLSSR